MNNHFHLSTTPLGMSVGQCGRELLSRLPAKIVRCVGLEITTLGEPIDLLIAMGVEHLGLAAQSLGVDPTQTHIHMYLERLAKMHNIHPYVDHLWLELDHAHPDRFSTFLGYPGNIQSKDDRISLLSLVGLALISNDAEESSLQAFRRIQHKLKDSHLVSKIEAGGHIISEVGWMDRPQDCHLKLLIAPGYRKHPAKLIENLFGPSVFAALSKQVFSPLSKGCNTEPISLSVHLSLALGPHSLKTALEISHTPTQKASGFDTEFCNNIKQLPGLETRATQVFDQLRAMAMATSDRASTPIQTRLSHIKIPFSGTAARPESSKFYIRLLPLDLNVPDQKSIF